MRIKNISSSTSLRGIVSISVFLTIFAIGFIIMCVFSSPVELFQAFLAIEDWYAKLWIGVLVFICPFLFIWTLISEINTRKKALKIYNQGFNLKYVDFELGRIEFRFVDPKYDFTCGYEDIENLELVLHTILVHTKNGSYIALSEIELIFKVLNGKTFSISNTPLVPLNLLYKIIDYTRGIKNFSYKFTGAGINEDVKERIEDYRKKGCKQILTSGQEDLYKFLSITFFVIGLFFGFAFLNDVTNAIAKGNFDTLFVIAPTFIFFIFSIAIDILLIVDKINDKKFGIHHKSKELIGKIPCEAIVAVEVIIIVISAFIFCKPLLFSINDNKILNANGEYKELWVNSPLELNNMRKDEIYSLRKAYVKDSLFNKDDYEPNESVFGAIEDYKPWWGTIICQPIGYEGDNHENIEGESQQSIQINNPNALVGLKSVYFMYDRHETDFCNSDYARFIPQSLKYNEKNNLIIAEYEVSKDFLNTYVQLDNKRKRFPLQLSGLNALDFGYKYVYAFNTKNIEMFYSNNITENVGMFRDYIHVGGSCGYEGGCNNISPMQNDKMITVSALPAEINLKLWKKQPYDQFSKADMYYRIIFKEQ